jgi:hypothetical protein
LTSGVLELRLLGYLINLFIYQKRKKNAFTHATHGEPNLAKQRPNIPNIEARFQFPVL